MFWGTRGNGEFGVINQIIKSSKKKQNLFLNKPKCSSYHLPCQKSSPSSKHGLFITFMPIHRQQTTLESLLLTKDKLLGWLKKTPKCSKILPTLSQSHNCCNCIFSSVPHHSFLKVPNKFDCAAGH